jgi:hypothetical protein
MMKKLHILSLWSLFLGLLTHTTYAQLSIGLGGTYTYYLSPGINVFGNASFPLTDVENLPTIVGGKLSGSFGFYEQNAVRFGIGYNMGLKEMPFMLGATGKISSLEFSLDYQRYLLGTYTGRGGVYALGGFTLLSTSLDFTVPDKDAMGNTGELKFFDPKSVLLTAINLGLGAEVLVLDKFYLFAEGNISIHTNAYVDNTTIKQSNLMYFVRGMAGFRVPLGGSGNSRGYKRKRF